jgi:hypothetical protein
VHQCCELSDCSSFAELDRMNRRTQPMGPCAGRPVAKTQPRRGRVCLRASGQPDGALYARAALTRAAQPQLDCILSHLLEQSSTSELSGRFRWHCIQPRAESHRSYTAQRSARLANDCYLTPSSTLTGTKGDQAADSGFQARLATQFKS